jgi:sterol desaturase/sphingolipid hydroxylase (fatty acid hydroxylase superfamily)
MNGRNPHRKHIRLFDSNRLERLSQISPGGFAVTWVFVLAIVAWIGWGLASPATGLGLFIAGLAAWFPFEYLMHRKLFHWEPRSSAVQRFVFVMHGNHHVDSNDPLRNLMPPIVSLPLGVAIWGIAVALLGPAGTWAFLGFAFGYVVYDLTHFACHQSPMKGRLASLLKRHHMRHHHVDESGNFAITAIFLDSLFRTKVEFTKSNQ